jgi:hypothetical protein
MTSYTTSSSSLRDPTQIVPIDVLFDADYLLSAVGSSLVPVDSELTLLLIHSKVCLVLRPAQRGVAPTMMNGALAWERVGIA